MASVAFDSVTKTFDGDVDAVADLTLTIEDGELLVLVGPSGCGKSTALRMVAGLETPTAGDVFIGGECVTEVAPRERDVAMVFQNYALYPHMTVERNLGFGLKIKRMPKSLVVERVAAAAHMLELTEHLQKRPAQLSGGQRQRVAMGRAIVREPQVFLMDEPLSNLDAKLRVAMRAEIVALQQELRTTLVHVTHDQVEAMTMGHRVAILRRGVLQQVAPPDELFDAPVNVFVAGFIGTPAMNLYHSDLTTGDDGFEAPAVGLGHHELRRHGAAGHGAGTLPGRPGGRGRPAPRRGVAVGRHGARHHQAGGVPGVRTPRPRRVRRPRVQPRGRFRRGRRRGTHGQAAGRATRRPARRLGSPTTAGRDPPPALPGDRTPPLRRRDRGPPGLTPAHR